MADSQADASHGRAWWLGCALCLLLLVPAAHASSIEIHSNGRGGGLWSDPDTWHDRQVPGPNDIVVIAMRDRVEFDGDAHDDATCRELYLDPEAVLSFREGRQHRVLSVAGPIESYGTIRIDGTGDRRGLYEIRLVGEGPSEEQRTIHLRENAGLLIYGHEQHRTGERNVRITAASLDGESAANADADDETDAEAERVPARIVADGNVMFDLHHAHIHDVRIELANLDNSGGSRERLNIIGNYITGLSMLRLENCDTPVIRDNHFHTDENVAPEFAVESLGNALAQFRGNTIEGPYETGMRINPDNNSTIADMRFIGVTTRGLYLRNSRDTSMRNLHIEGDDAMEGVWVQTCPAGVLLEQVHVKDARRGYNIRHSRAQLTDCSAEGLHVPEDADAGVALHVHRSAVRLINSPFEPDEIDINPEGSPPGDDPYVETMQYVIVRVTPADSNGDAGQAAGQRSQEELNLPPGLQVRLQTAEESGGVPEGRADLNVRNSPVPASRTTGFTPMPRSQRALAVRSWRFDRDAQFRQAPFYELIIEVPSGEDDGTYETLVSRTIEPRAEWFRPEPNRPEPTIEVRLP